MECQIDKLACSLVRPAAATNGRLGVDSGRCMGVSKGPSYDGIPIRQEWGGARACNFFLVRAEGQIGPPSEAHTAAIDGR